MLLKINLKQGIDTIKVGSLVHLNNQLYFISISLGKVIFENQSVYCISTASPIGKLLIGKCNGDNINWNNQILKIEAVY